MAGTDRRYGRDAYIHKCNCERLIVSLDTEVSRLAAL